MLGSDSTHAKIRMFVKVGVMPKPNRIPERTRVRRNGSPIVAFTPASS
jgi:hypothetical protein